MLDAGTRLDDHIMIVVAAIYQAQHTLYDIRGMLEELFSARSDKESYHFLFDFADDLHVIVRYQSFVPLRRVEVLNRTSCGQSWTKCPE